MLYREDSTVILMKLIGSMIFIFFGGKVNWLYDVSMCKVIAA